MNKESWLTSGVGLALTVIVVTPILAAAGFWLAANWQTAFIIAAMIIFTASVAGLICDYFKEK